MLYRIQIAPRAFARPARPVAATRSRARSRSPVRRGPAVGGTPSAVVVAAADFPKIVQPPNRAFTRSSTDVAFVVSAYASVSIAAPTTAARSRLTVSAHAASRRRLLEVKAWTHRARHRRSPPRARRKMSSSLPRAPSSFTRAAARGSSARVRRRHRSIGVLRRPVVVDAAALDARGLARVRRATPRALEGSRVDRARRCAPRRRLARRASRRRASRRRARAPRAARTHRCVDATVRASATSRVSTRENKFL